MDDPALTLISALAPLCKQHGIRRARIGDLEIEFGSTGEVNKELVKEFAQQLDQGLPSDEEVLFHSAPGFVPADKEAPLPPAPTTRQRKGKN